MPEPYKTSTSARSRSELALSSSCALTSSAFIASAALSISKTSGRLLSGFGAIKSLPISLESQPLLAPQ